MQKKSQVGQTIWSLTYPRRFKIIKSEIVAVCCADSSQLHEDQCIYACSGPEQTQQSNDAFEPERP